MKVDSLKLIWTTLCVSHSDLLSIPTILPRTVLSMTPMYGEGVRRINCGVGHACYEKRNPSLL